MLSAMPKALGRSLKISSTFCQNISFAGTALNSSMVNLYLPNGHANVVKYEDFCHILGYDKLSLYMLGLNQMHLLVLEICHSLLVFYVLALLAPCLGSRHKHTVPFGWVIMTKLLHCSAVPSALSGAIIFFFIVFPILS